MSEARQNIVQRALAALRTPRGLGIAAGALALLLVLRSCGGGSEIVFETEEVSRGDLVVRVTATGTLQPINQVDVGSELSGTIRDVKVDFNSVVKKGDVLARLDTQRLEAQVLQSESALAAAEARIEEASASRLEADARLARLERVHEMSGGKVPSAAELDGARASAARAKAEVASASAAAKQARATLDTQRTDLSKAEIRSPIDGVVLKRLIEPGQTVAAAMTTPILFTLAEDLRAMELLVAIDEADISNVAEGQRADFTVDAWPGRTFEAEVVQVRYGADAAEGVVAYGALLRVANPELRLRPGMTATAEIVVKRVDGALLVPNAALRFSPPEIEDTNLFESMMSRPWWNRPKNAAKKGVEQVVHREKKGALEPVAITIGSTDGVHTEVVKGELAPGDALAVAAKPAAS
ncbi:MAG: efflux RND transporter periplasmic adaptor subunit [Deltaproteobacteria bacterium]|nr:efflux RND transporter periplasmic adaptor subunit [Deltaproteobacteria bacterium]